MGLPNSRLNVGRLALLFVCVTAPGCERNDATERRVDRATAPSAPSRKSASRPVFTIDDFPPLPLEKVIGSKYGDSCEELRRCFAETLPKKYDPAQKQAVEAGIRTCQGTREFSTLEKCVPHEFGHDVRNGFALEVRGEANCQGCLCEPRLTFGYHFDSDEECFCRRARAGQPPASREACYHPDELPALAPNDEIRLSGDAVGGVHVERAPFGGRLWYLGFAPVLGSGHLRPPPKERVLTINGTVPSSSDAAAKLLGGPLTGLRGIDLMRSGHLHRIAYVDRVVLDELFAELHRALAEGWPQKACLDVRQSTEIYFRTQKYAFDDSCKGPVTVRLTKLVERVLHLVDKPRRRPVAPLSCSALEKHPISLKVQTRTQFVELRAIDWWSRAPARVPQSSQDGSAFDHRRVRFSTG